MHILLLLLSNIISERKHPRLSLILLGISTHILLSSMGFEMDSLLSIHPFSVLLSLHSGLWGSAEAFLRWHVAPTVNL